MEQKKIKQIKERLLTNTKLDQKKVSRHIDKIDNLVEFFGLRDEQEAILIFARMIEQWFFCFALDNDFFDLVNTEKVEILTFDHFMDRELRLINRFAFEYSSKTGTVLRPDGQLYQKSQLKEMKEELKRKYLNL